MAGVAAAGVATAAPSRARAARRRAVRRGIRYGCPAFLLLTVVTGVPLVYSVVVSLYDYSFASAAATFTVLSNYRQVVGDQQFWHSVTVTLNIAVPALVLEVVLGTAVAPLLNRWARGRAFWITLVPAVFLTVVGQRYLVRGLTAGSVK